MDLNFWKEGEQAVAAQAMYQQPSGMPEASHAMEPEHHYPVEEKKQVYNTVAKWAVYVAAALLPVFFLPWSTSVLELNKQLLLVVAAGVGLVAWLLGIVISGQASLRLNAVDKGVGAIFGAAAIATIFSIVKYKSLFGLNVSLSESLVTLSALSILYFLAVNVFEDRGRSLRTVLSVSVLATLAYGALQMFSVYILPFAFSKSRAFNSVGSVNALGLLAAVSLPVFSKLRLLIRGNKNLDVSKLGLVLCLLILAVLNWWVLWAVAVAGMIAVIAVDSFFNTRSDGHGRRFRMAEFVMPMTIVVLAVFLMIVKFNLASVKDNLPVEIAPSHKLSADVARSVLGESLVFGYGPENYSLAFDRYGAGVLANTTLAGIRFFDSTSQVLNFVTHGGLLMVLALLLMAWTLIEALRKARESVEPDQAAGFTAAVASLAALTAGLFLYPFGAVLMGVLYFSTALLVLSVWGGRKNTWNIEEKPVVSLVSSLGFIAGLILVLAGSYFTFLNYFSDVTFAKAAAQTEPNKAIEHVAKAINRNGQDDRYYRTASQLALGLLSTELKKGQTQDPNRAALIQNYLTSAIDLARRATQIGERESQNWTNLGNVYEALLGLVQDVDKLAEESYLKAAELRPGDPSFHNRIGSMYLTKADLVRQLARSAVADTSRYVQEYNASLEKAEVAFKKAVELASNYGLAIYNLGAVYDRQGKVREAITEIEKIIPFNANQPGLVFELGLLYYRAGRKDDALAALQRSVLLSPQFANARWYLALIYEERKDIDAAIEQLNKILETNKDNEVVTAKLAQLEAGKAQIPPLKVLDQKPLP